MDENKTQIDAREPMSVIVDGGKVTVTKGDSSVTTTKG